MKKLILFSSISMLTFSLNAQDYFQRFYPTTTGSGQTNEVSCAIKVGNAPTMPPDEYAIASYQTSANSGTYNFEIHRIDGTGQYSIGGPPTWAISFFDSYNVWKATTPFGSPSLLYANTHGVSMIETGTNPGAPGTHYAVAGTVSDATIGSSGCFFLFLNADGNVINQQYYEFPATAFAPSKPLLIEDVTTPGDYIICGSYYDSALSKSVMYFISTNGSSPYYSLVYESGHALIPYGMIQSPYNSSEIVIVGETAVDPTLYPGRGLDGFFMKINKNTGNYITSSMKVYGNSAEQHFASIAVAKSPSPSSDGYIIGGVSPSTSSAGKSWMLKVDQTGGNIWNQIITGSTGTNKDVTGVLERINTSSNYEYYGVTSTGMNQMTVFKLDASGALFTTANNEFEYKAGGGGPAFITNHNNSTYGPGIQVFGTDAINTTYSQYMVKAYYNGVSGNGCGSFESLNSINTQVTGPSNIINPAVNSSGPAPTLYPGSDFNVSTNLSPGNFAVTTTHCSGLSGSGSNARSTTTGINEYENNSQSSVMPNPASTELTVSLIVKFRGTVKVDFVNSLGQIAKSVQLSIDAGKQDLKIDVTDLEAGVYFLNCEMNGTKTNSKVVITH